MNSNSEFGRNLVSCCKLRVSYKHTTALSVWYIHAVVLKAPRCSSPSSSTLITMRETCRFKNSRIYSSVQVSTHSLTYCFIGNPWYNKPFSNIHLTRLISIMGSFTFSIMSPTGVFADKKLAVETNIRGKKIFYRQPIHSFINT